MIKPNKSYRVYKVRKGTTSSGNNYTIAKIAESERDENIACGWKKRYYSVYVNEDVNLFENCEFSFSVIDGVKSSENIYNGKTYNGCTLFVNSENITVTKSADEVLANNANPWAEEELPFG